MRQGCEGPVWVVDDLSLCFQQRSVPQNSFAFHFCILLADVLILTQTGFLN